MKKPPISMIDARGRLTTAMVDFLEENFGFSRDVLQKTVYKQIRFHKSAITLYQYVLFDAKCFKKSEAEWLLLIIHEQVHRQEIGNHLLKALTWYFGYLAGFVRAGFSYRNNSYEERAYAKERAALHQINHLKLML